MISTLTTIPPVRNDWQEGFLVNLDKYFKELRHIDIQCRLWRHTLFTGKVLQKFLRPAHDTAKQVGKPTAVTDRPADVSWICVCLISNIVSSEMPVISAISAVLFHSCLVALSALISFSFGLFLPFFCGQIYAVFVKDL